MTCVFCPPPSPCPLPSLPKITFLVELMNAGRLTGAGLFVYVPGFGGNVFKAILFILLFFSALSLIFHFLLSFFWEKPCEAVLCPVLRGSPGGASPDPTWNPLGFCFGHLSALLVPCSRDSQGPAGWHTNSAAQGGCAVPRAAGCRKAASAVPAWLESQGSNV